VAIIMSLYHNDKADELTECLESIFNQSYKEYDLLLYYDGLIETATRSVIDSFAIERSMPIYTIEFDVNHGLAFGLNQLITSYSGYEYYVRMDADDIMREDRIEEQVAFLESNLDIDVVGSDYFEFSNDGKYIKTVRFPSTHKEMEALFAYRNPIAHVSAVFRKSYFDKAGLYPLNTIKDEDTVMWLNGFLSECRFANLSLPLVKVRISDAFFKRRSGHNKSYADMKNRFLVINQMNYSKKYYLVAIIKYIIQVTFPPTLMRLMYSKFR